MVNIREWADQPPGMHLTKGKPVVRRGRKISGLEVFMPDSGIAG